MNMGFPQVDYTNYSPDNFRIKLMELSNQLNLMYETDSVFTQVQILTDNFLLALDSCAPFPVKLIKRPPARWMTETIKNEINQKCILINTSQSWKILPNCGRKHYKQQKMIISKLIKKSKCSIIMKHSIMLEKILKTPGTY